MSKTLEIPPKMPTAESHSMWSSSSEDVGEPEGDPTSTVETLLEDGDADNVDNDGMVDSAMGSAYRVGVSRRRQHR